MLGVHRAWPIRHRHFGVQVLKCSIALSLRQSITFIFPHSVPPHQWLCCILLACLYVCRLGYYPQIEQSLGAPLLGLSSTLRLTQGNPPLKRSASFQRLASQALGLSSARLLFRFATLVRGPPVAWLPSVSALGLSGVSATLACGPSSPSLSRTRPLRCSDALQCSATLLLVHSALSR